MTLTTIVAGMEKGPEAIDANFKDNLLEISDWSATGLTYLNGFSQHTIDMPNTLKYRTIKLGGVLIETQFAGFSDAPALKSTLGVVEICKLPSGILRSNFVNLSNQIESVATDQFVGYGIDTDRSALMVNLWGLTKELTDVGKIRTNLCVSW